MSELGSRDHCGRRSAPRMKLSPGYRSPVVRASPRRRTSASWRLSAWRRDVISPARSLARRLCTRRYQLLFCLQDAAGKGRASEGITLPGIARLGGERTAAAHFPEPCRRCKGPPGLHGSVGRRSRNHRKTQTGEPLPLWRGEAHGLTQSLGNYLDGFNGGSRRRRPPTGPRRPHQNGRFGRPPYLRFQ